jgi:hypothetical protein
MADIMTHLHQFVPTVCNSQEHTIGTSQMVQEESTSLHPILVGGDQLTAARLEMQNEWADTHQDIVRNCASC